LTRGFPEQLPAEGSPDDSLGPQAETPRHADLVEVCDVLAITVAAAVLRLGMDAEEFLVDVRSRLGGYST
jgi:hypothetical protein